MLGLAIPFRGSDAAVDTCWPVGNITFTAGSKQEVTRGAVEFLIKVEDVPKHAYWPTGMSGVTLGVGWDMGYHSLDELRQTWASLGTDVLARLAVAVGKKGRAAQALVPQLESIVVPQSLSIQVLACSLDNFYYPFVIHLFPGLERLPPEVQIVFISIVFNRGPNMGRDPD
jgi:hypothetical protein